MPARSTVVRCLSILPNSVRGRSFPINYKINYKPQFGGEIFRPRDVVKNELAALEHEEVKPVKQPQKA